MKNLKFRKAKPEEIDIVLLFLKEAALWLREKGIDYWQNWILPPSNFINWIRRGFDNNEFYLVEDDNDIIGCFRLQWQDPNFWGEQKDNAGYIHSLTISRRLAGQDIGRDVLSMIESYCRQNNKEFLRLDCGVDVTGLKKYYEQNDFRPVRDVIVSEYKLTLYEKRI
jgi:GNAT superfamily N-acetyltransferase